jgi:beta-lactamase class A
MQGKLVVSENSIKYVVSRYSEEKNKIQGERWGIKAKIAWSGYRIDKDGFLRAQE